MGEKNTPRQALLQLERAVYLEICLARNKEEAEHTKHGITILMMSKETLEQLKSADIDQDFCIGLPSSFRCYLDGKIEALLSCEIYTGYVVLAPEMALGKVIIRRCRYGDIQNGQK